MATATKQPCHLFDNKTPHQVSRAGVKASEAYLRSPHQKKNV
jgi:hypothetical protein